MNNIKKIILTCYLIFTNCFAMQPTKDSSLVVSKLRAITSAANANANCTQNIILPKFENSPQNQNLVISSNPNRINVQKLVPLAISTANQILQQTTSFIAPTLSPLNLYYNSITKQWIAPCEYDYWQNTAQENYKPVYKDSAEETIKLEHKAKIEANQIRLYSEIKARNFSYSDK